jgi:HK97 family phage major capsid protein
VLSLLASDKAGGTTNVTTQQDLFLNPPSDELVYQLQDEMRAKRKEAQEKWIAFDQERDRMAKANRLTDDAVATHLEEMQADYQKSNGEYQEIEKRWAVEAVKPHPTERSDGGYGAKDARGWGEAVFAKLVERKALDATSGGTIPPPFFDPALRRLPERNLFVRSIIPVIQGDGDRASYLRQTVRTNLAAPVDPGDMKPTSVYSVERIEAPYRTIAHLTEPQDRNLLSDYEGLIRFLNDELRLGLLLTEEDQILNGDGDAPNLEGILEVTGIGDQPRGTDSISDALLRGLNVVRNDGLVEPDAIVMAPTDYEAAVLEKTDGSGEYIHGSPNNTTTPQLWGKPVITSPVLDAGTALVGSFATGCAIYDREQPRIDFSEQHEDLFEKNQVLWRGEERLTFAVFRPKAFATVSDLTPEP